MQAHKPLWWVCQCFLRSCSWDNGAAEFFHLLLSDKSNRWQNQAGSTSCELKLVFQVMIDNQVCTIFWICSEMRFRKCVLQTEHVLHVSKPAKSNSVLVTIPVLSNVLILQGNDNQAVVYFRESPPRETWL